MTYVYMCSMICIWDKEQKKGGMENERRMNIVTSTLLIKNIKKFRCQGKVGQRKSCNFLFTFFNYR